jgi:hypothetical protein
MRFRRYSNEVLGVLAALAMGGLAAGCWNDPGPTAEGTNGAPAPTGAGRISIAWTLGGQPASSASCAGVDHLILELQYNGGGGVEISPIPCTIGRLRYDQLPEGAADLILSAVDASGCETWRGQSTLTVAADLPASPAPTVALSAVPRCQ